MNTTLIIITIIDLIGLGLILKWMYDDARAREMMPWGWLILTGLLSPNFIGLILYFLFRRKDHEINCNRCDKKISHSMNYCPWCGISNESKDRSIPVKPSINLLIAGIVIMIVCLLAFLIFFLQY